MRFWSILSVVMIAAAPAAARAASLPDVTPPKMIGVWKPTGVVGAARLGEAVAGWPQSDKPLFNLKPRPSVVITEQRDREIAGYEIFADGSHEPLVGVFTLGGKLLVDTMRGSAVVDFYGDQIEWCWQSSSPHVAVVSCDVMRRVSDHP